MEQQPDSTARGSFLSILLALIFGGGFLFFLILVTGGFFFYVALAVLGVGSIGFLHYVLWGQALTDEVAQERAADEDAFAPEERPAWSQSQHIRRL